MECELAYWRSSGKHLNQQESCVKHELSRPYIERSGDVFVVEEW